MTMAESADRAMAHGVRVCMNGRLDSAEEAEMLDFLARCPSASYLQRPDWPALCPPPARHSYTVIRARDSSGALVAAGLARLSRLAPRRFLASFRRGPVARTPEDLAHALPAIGSALREAGCCSVLVSPRWSGADAGEASRVLRSLGAMPRPDWDQPLHVTTGLISLSGSGEDLSGRLKQRCRRQIRKAEKCGLSVRPAATLEDAMLFEPVLRQFYEKRGLDLASLPPVSAQWRMTRERGAFLLGWLDGRVVAGHVMIADGSRAFWLVLARLDSLKGIPAGYALVWEALKTAQVQGFEAYDMAGISAANADGEAAADNAAAQRDQFKRAFGPEVVQLVPAHVLPLRQPEHAILFGLRSRYRAAAADRRPTG